MVLGEQLDRWFKKREQERLDKAVTQARSEARSEALDHARRQLQVWNRRRLEAEAQGQPFDEPPPSFDSNGTTEHS